MFLKTHIAISFLFFLIFLDYIFSPLIFLFAAFIGTILPDIDTRFSSIGKKKKYRILQYFSEHRGFFHSFTFLFLILGVLFVFSKIVAFGFAFGFSLHLFSDALTKKGISPFYPFKLRIKGFLKTGGYIEKIIFIFLLFFNLIILVRIYLNLFGLLFYS